MWRICTAALVACLLSGVRAEARDAPIPVAAPSYRPDAREAAFLDELARDTFRFFWEATPAATGLTPDRAPGESAASVAGVGFALPSYLIGAERGWVTRAAAVERTLRTLRTLWYAPQGPARTGVSGHRGLFYHFLDPVTATRAGANELSTIDTALLMAGVLAAGVYFDGDAPQERAIRALADALYLRVDWRWATSPHRPPLLGMGWTPEEGFLAHSWEGYNEGMILYVLALGSPAHGIAPAAWEAWSGSYRWMGGSKLEHVAFGPLFGHQYSQAFVDFRGIRDAPMRARGSDYFENSVRATYANRDHCVNNPGGFEGYGPLVWGLTASDGPADRPAPGSGERAFRAYWARGAWPDGAADDDGTIAPTAAGGSIAFAPEIVVPTLVHLRERFGDRLYGRWGFKDAFNLSYAKVDPRHAGGWFDEQYLAIDQGPILLMLENYRSGLVWELLKRSPYVVNGLRRAGFTGGWLDTARPALTAVR